MRVSKDSWEVGPASLLDHVDNAWSMNGVVLGLSASRKLNTIRIRLAYESLDVTLAYLKGRDAKSEEAEEHANSSSLALYD